MMDLKVGQKVWVKRIGNEARYLDNKKASIEDYVSEAEVVSVARKYFTLKSNGIYLDRSKFFIDSGHDDRKGYISGFRVYLSKQEILDEAEAERLFFEIRKEWFDIGRSSISLEQLRAIRAILTNR